MKRIAGHTLLAVLLSGAGTVAAGAAIAQPPPTVIDQRPCIPVGVTTDEHGWISIEVCDGHILRRRMG